MTLSETDSTMILTKLQQIEKMYKLLRQIDITIEEMTDSQCFTGMATVQRQYGAHDESQLSRRQILYDDTGTAGKYKNETQNTEDEKPKKEKKEKKEKKKKSGDEVDDGTEQKKKKKKDKEKKKKAVDELSSEQQSDNTTETTQSEMTSQQVLLMSDYVKVQEEDAKEPTDQNDIIVQQIQQTTQEPQEQQTNEVEQSDSATQSLNFIDTVSEPAQQLEEATISTTAPEVTNEIKLVEETTQNEPLTDQVISEQINQQIDQQPTSNVEEEVQEDQEKKDQVEQQEIQQSQANEDQVVLQQQQDDDKHDQHAENQKFEQNEQLIQQNYEPIVQTQQQEVILPVNPPDPNNTIVATLLNINESELNRLQAEVDTTKSTYDDDKSNHEQLDQTNKADINVNDDYNIQQQPDYQETLQELNADKQQQMQSLNEYMVSSNQFVNQQVANYNEKIVPYNLSVINNNNDITVEPEDDFQEIFNYPESQAPKYIVSRHSYSKSRNIFLPPVDQQTQSETIQAASPVSPTNIQQRVKSSQLMSDESDYEELQEKMGDDKETQIIEHAQPNAASQTEFEDDEDVDEEQLMKLSGMLSGLISDQMRLTSIYDSQYVGAVDE